MPLGAAELFLQRWLDIPGNRAEWERLRAVLDLAEGFQFFPIVAADAAAEAAVERLLKLELQQRGIELATFDLSRRSRVQPMVSAVLALLQLALRPCIFYLRGGARMSPRGEELGELFLFLNQKRDVVAERAASPLLLSLSPSGWAVFRNFAPDFWSIHQSVFRFSFAAEQETDTVSRRGEARIRSGRAESVAARLGLPVHSAAGNAELDRVSLIAGVEPAYWRHAARSLARLLVKGTLDCEFRRVGVPAASPTRALGTVRGTTAREGELRSAERSRLVALLLESEGRIAVIGPAGAGKTTLVQRVLPEIEKLFPGGIFFVSLLEFGRREPAARILRRTLEELRPGIADFVEPEALSRVFELVTSEYKILLVIDDLDWNESAAAAITSLKTGPGSALVALGIRRPSADWEILNVGPINAEESYLALSEVAQAMPKAVARSLSESLERSPLALVIAGRSWNEDPSLVKGWIEESGDSSRLDLAEVVKQVAQRLSGETRRVWAAASLFRGAFDLEQLRAVAGPQEGKTGESAISELVKWGLVFEDGIPDLWRIHSGLRKLARSFLNEESEEATRRAYALYHLRLGVGSGSAVTQSDRQLGPEIAAALEWIAELLADGRHLLPTVRASLVTAARDVEAAYNASDPDLTAAWYRAAARAAEEDSDFDLAATTWSRAAAAHHIFGAWSEAQTCLELARRSASVASLRQVSDEAWLRLSSAALAAGDQLLGRGLAVEIARRGPPALQVWSCLVAGLAALERGDLRIAEEDLAGAKTLAESGAGRRWIGLACLIASWVGHELSTLDVHVDYEAQVHDAKLAVESAREEDDITLLARALAILAKWRYLEVSTALRAAQEGLQLARAANDLHGEYLALSVLGNLHMTAGEASVAEREYRRAVTIASALHGTNSVSTARCLLRLGRALLNLGSTLDAEDYLRQALAALRAAGAGEGHEGIWFLEVLGRALAVQGKLNEAEECVRNALAVANAAYRPDHYSIVALALLLAQIQVSDNRFDEALTTIDEAFAALGPRDETSDVDLRVRAELLELHIDVLRRLGRLSEGLSLLRDEQLPLLEALGDELGKARGLAQEAELLEEMGSVSEALIVREDALATYERLGDLRSTAAMLAAIANDLANSGRFDESLRTLRERVIPATEIVGDLRLHAAALDRMATILSSQGNKDEALRVRREEELPIYERIGDKRSVALTLIQIADDLRNVERHEEALKLYERARQDVQALGDERLRAFAVSKIADILHFQGALAEALSLRRYEELPVYQKLHDVQRAAVTLLQISDMLIEEGKLSEAFEVIRDEALPIFDQLAEGQWKATAWMKIALIYALQGQLGKALETIETEMPLSLEATRATESLAAALERVAEVLAAAGDLDGAIQVRRRQLSAMSTPGRSDRQAVALKALIELLLKRGSESDRREAATLSDVASSMPIRTASP